MKRVAKVSRKAYAEKKNDSYFNQYKWDHPMFQGKTYNNKAMKKPAIPSAGKQRQPVPSARNQVTGAKRWKTGTVAERGKSGDWCEPREIRRWVRSAEKPQLVPFLAVPRLGKPYARKPSLLCT